MAEANEAPSGAIGRHVAGLDGIRAVDMAAMMLFHAQLSAKGAFLALSQFFTLSGFLIVSLLVRRLDATSRIDLVDFWGRRYRRLMPASMLTLAGILVFGMTLATEPQVDAIRRGVVAAVAQVVNWQFVFTDVSYVELFQSPSPVQHFWSLAVEEQFYLVVPLVMVGVHILTRSVRAITATFAALTLGSTLLMYWLFERGASIDRLYYGTDTRAAEMLMGGLLALVLHQYPPRLGPRARRAAGWVGALAFAGSVWGMFSLSLTDAWMYQGGLLLFSALTCLAIFALVLDAGPLARVLGWRPFAATGRITYGIYLFHWPLILVLTEERVGFGGWPLFLIVLVPVTVGLAWASARWFETPIRYTRATAGDLRFSTAMATGAIVLVVGAVALQWRDVETDLAGLGDVASAAPAVTVDDQPLVVAVIGDEAGLSFAATMNVPVAANVTFDPDPQTWNTEWGALIDSVDPDVVLFHVSDWDAELPTEDVLAALDAGFDVLTRRGATVAWGVGPADIAAAVRAESDPFRLAMRQLSTARRDVRRLGVVDDPVAVEADLELARRRADGDAPRLLIVGDSVSRTIGYGLEQWALDTGEAVVWSAGTEGCGVANGGLVNDAFGREVSPPPLCDSVASGWADQIATFDPDVVLVVSSAADFQERRLPGWPGMREPGDPEFDSWLVEQYVAAVDTLSAGGAQVVWAENACALDVFGRFDEPDGGNAVDDERIRHVNDVILPKVVEERPAVTTYDLDAILCPDGEMLTQVDGVGTLRGDGIHFTPEGSRWFADAHARELLALV